MLKKCFIRALKTFKKRHRYHFRQLNLTIEEKDEKIDNKLDDHMALVNAKISAIEEKVNAERAAPQLDPWQAGRAAAAARAMAVDSSGSADPLGSAAARATSNKRRFVTKEGPTQVDPRNQRNPLRLHLKGFDRKVPPRSIEPYGTRSWARLAT